MKTSLQLTLLVKVCFATRSRY